jgi:hypothetical protein
MVLVVYVTKSRRVVYDQSQSDVERSVERSLEQVDGVCAISQLSINSEQSVIFRHKRSI